MDGFFAGLFDLQDEKVKKPVKAKQELSDQSNYECWSSGIESDEESFVSAFMSPLKKVIP